MSYNSPAPRVAVPGLAAYGGMGSYGGVPGYANAVSEETDQLFLTQNYNVLEHHIGETSGPAGPNALVVGMPCFLFKRQGVDHLAQSTGHVLAGISAVNLHLRQFRGCREYRTAEEVLKHWKYAGFCQEDAMSARDARLRSAKDSTVTAYGMARMLNIWALPPPDLARDQEKGAVCRNGARLWLCLETVDVPQIGVPPVLPGAKRTRPDFLVSDPPAPQPATCFQFVPRVSNGISPPYHESRLGAGEERYSRPATVHRQIPCGRVGMIRTGFVVSENAAHIAAAAVHGKDEAEIARAVSLLPDFSGIVY